MVERTGMRESLLEILVEPKTYAPLRLENAERRGERIDRGVLVSSGSGRRYPIVRGIPRFSGRTYADSFGYQWNRFRAVQLDSATRTNASGRRFDRETDGAELRGKRVLDAGCGAGRFAEIAVARGAHVVALDLSSAVEATAQTVPDADVVQGDLLEPPFAPGSFDFAYSLGVIQHTPDRQAAIRSVVRCIRSGGGFALAVYARRPWTKLHGKYLVRPITRRVPEAQLARALEATMPVLFPLTDLLFSLPLVGRLARFAIPIANYVERDDLTRDQRYAEALLDTFDMLSPRYDEPMTPAEVEAALRAVGAISWRFLARRPIQVVGVR
jgi:SAM-dependent methyltransferase